MNRTIKRLLATAVSGLVLAGTIGAGTAMAAPPRAPGLVAEPGADRVAIARCAPLRAAARAEPTVANLQALGRCEIDGRLAALARLQASVDASPALTDAHEAALDAILSSTGAGLRALRTEIDGDTTVEALRDDLRRIVEDFRVYLLVAPQVVLVEATDRVGVAATRLDTAAGRLEAAIGRAEAAGRDVGDARQHLATMRAKTAAARSAVDGVAAAVLALTPAAWNAGDAAPVLQRARAALREARVDLREALAAARAVLADLR
jgi:hypothetical protein